MCGRVASIVQEGRGSPGRSAAQLAHRCLEMTRSLPAIVVAAEDAQGVLEGSGNPDPPIVRKFGCFQCRYDLLDLLGDTVRPDRAVVHSQGFRVRGGESAAEIERWITHGCLQARIELNRGGATIPVG